MKDQVIRSSIAWKVKEKRGAARILTKSGDTRTIQVSSLADLAGLATILNEQKVFVDDEHIWTDSDDYDFVKNL